MTNYSKAALAGARAFFVRIPSSEPRGVRARASVAEFAAKLSLASQRSRADAHPGHTPAALADKLVENGYRFEGASPNLDKPFAVPTVMHRSVDKPSGVPIGVDRFVVESDPDAWVPFALGKKQGAVRYEWEGSDAPRAGIVSKPGGPTPRTVEYVSTGDFGFTREGTLASVMPGDPLWKEWGMRKLSVHDLRLVDREGRSVFELDVTFDGKPFKMYSDGSRGLYGSDRWAGKADDGSTLTFGISIGHPIGPEYTPPPAGAVAH